MTSASDGGFAPAGGVLVVGMHRSGTSAAVRLVNLMSVSLSEAYDVSSEPAPDNPTGHWESLELRRLNDQLLARLGGSWSVPPDLGPGWETDASLGAFAGRASEAFSRLFPSRPWAWKDPRNCLTLPFWLEVTRARPVVVWIHRHPYEIAQSLASRNGFTQAHSLALWHRYVRAGLANSAGLPVHLTTYERLLDDPGRFCGDVAEFLARHGIRAAPPPRDSIAGFIDASLRHSIAAQSPDEALPDDASVLNRRLEELRGDHDRFLPPDLGDEPEWVGAMFAEHRTVDDQRERLVVLQTTINDVRAEDRAKSLLVDRLRAEIGTLEDRVDELAHVITRLEDHSAQQAEGIGWLREEITARDRQLRSFVDSRSGRIAARLQRLQPRRVIVGIAGRTLPVAAKRSLKRIWDPTQPRSMQRLRAGPGSRGLEAVEDVPSAPTYDIVCLSIIDWEFRWQRPQQLMSRFAREGHRVFYVSATRFAPTSGSFEISELRDGVWELRLGCPPFDPYSGIMPHATVTQLLESLDRARDALKIDAAVCVAQVPTWAPAAIAARERFGWHVVYDCMDDWTDFPGVGPAADRAEHELVSGCDLLVASGRELAGAWSTQRLDALLVPNGLDGDTFGEGPATDRLARIPRPIVGYVGAIARWIDLDLLERLARERPAYSMVMAGGVFDVDTRRLTRLPNVHMLGQRPYEEMPGLVRAFDVCLIPFVLSEVTHAVDPVKLYEYLSQGKPVIATRTRELQRYSDLVYLAEGPDGFVRALDEALAEQDPAAHRRRIDFARANTWADRVATIKSGIRATYPKVSVVVVTHNNLDDTRRCLESVLNRSMYPNLEVIVVDNASTDGTQAYIESLTTGETDVRLIANGENRGFAAANNQGLAVATGERLILLNNDTVVPGGWLHRLLPHLDRIDVGLVVAVTNFSGNESRIDVHYDSLDEMDGFARELARARHGEYFDIRVAAMYCVGMRRDVYERVGRLDERFGMGLFEDDDYSERMRSEGYRVICAEDAFVHHVGQASFKKLSAREYQRLWDANQRLYEEKWERTWEKHEQRTTVDAPATAHPSPGPPVELAAGRGSGRVSPELQARIASQEWLRHNLRFDAETVTIPGSPEFLEADRRFLAIVQALHTIVGPSLRGLRVADLGCLEGGFSLGLALKGAEVTGFEARQLNMDKLALIEEHFRLPNLHFTLDDVKDFTAELTGTWDCVLALGILYHLDRPVEWLRQVAETTMLLVVDSHFAPPDASMSRLDERLTLGPMEQMEVLGRTYEGRWFYEYGPEHNPEAQALASYSNRSSFWLSRPSLFRAIIDAGFPFVWEHQDAHVLNNWDQFSMVYPRTMLFAVKPPDRSASPERAT